jgi:hypothetical protein
MEHFIFFFELITVGASCLNLILSALRKSRTIWAVYQFIGLIIGLVFLLLGIIIILSEIF